MYPVLQDSCHWVEGSACFSDVHVHSLAKLVRFWFLQMHLEQFWVFCAVNGDIPPSYCRCLVLSKPFSVGTVISPKQKKPKKQRVAAAQIIRISLFVCWGDQWSFSPSRIARVIGSRTFEDIWVACVCLIPAWTKRSLGNDENPCSSGRPMVICTWQIATKYTLIVWGDNLSVARYEA